MPNHLLAKHAKEDSMAKKSARGSDKLFAGLATGQARALQSALKGWKIIDWHELGKPSVELITGGISGSPRRTGTVINKLLKLKEVRDIEILINGQPRPDLAEVRFRLRARAGR
jgi:hypothetical protein